MKYCFCVTPSLPKSCLSKKGVAIFQTLKKKNPPSFQSPQAVFDFKWNCINQFSEKKTPKSPLTRINLMKNYKMYCFFRSDKLGLMISWATTHLNFDATRHDFISPIYLRDRNHERDHKYLYQLHAWKNAIMCISKLKILLKLT